MSLSSRGARRQRAGATRGQGAGAQRGGERVLPERVACRREDLQLREVGQRGRQALQHVAVEAEGDVADARGAEAEVADLVRQRRQEVVREGELLQRPQLADRCGQRREAVVAQLQGRQRRQVADRGRQRREAAVLQVDPRDAPAAAVDPCKPDPAQPQRSLGATVARHAGAAAFSASSAAQSAAHVIVLPHALVAMLLALCGHSACGQLPQGLPVIAPPALAMTALEGHTASLLLSRYRLPGVTPVSLISEAGSDVRPFFFRRRTVSAVRSPIEAGSDVRPQCSGMMNVTRPPWHRMPCEGDGCQPQRSLGATFARHAGAAAISASSAAQSAALGSVLPHRVTHCGV